MTPAPVPEISSHQNSGRDFRSHQNSGRDFHSHLRRAVEANGRYWSDASSGAFQAFRSCIGGIRQAAV
jgi:hypothetical protein